MRVSNGCENGVIWIQSTCATSCEGWGRNEATTVIVSVTAEEC